MISKNDAGNDAADFDLNDLYSGQGVTNYTYCRYSFSKVMIRKRHGKLITLKNLFYKINCIKSEKQTKQENARLFCDI